MTLQEFKEHFIGELVAYYPEDECLSFLQLLLEDRLGLTRVQTALKPQLKIASEDLDYLRDAIEELGKERPIQYILGKTQFYGLEFTVNEQVLIPRPETEELVDWILQELAIQNKSDEKLTVLDIGTGSGCIAVSLAKHLANADVYALDISSTALQLAKENASSNKVEIYPIESDILNVNQIRDADERALQFDVIVSNPPYVLEDEKKEIKTNVLDYEPHLALFVNDPNPLLFYEKIAVLAQQHLKQNGHLFFEINQYLGTQTVDLLSAKGFSSPILRKDLSQNDRMIMTTKGIDHKN